MSAPSPLYLDSHLHLQDTRLTSTLDRILERAKAAGVAKMLCNATHEEDWQSVVDLAIRIPEALPFLGIHPWFAETAKTGWEDRLLHLLALIPAGIGEIGLDKACRVDFGRQQQIFASQLEMAATLKRPLSIHCVKAWGPLVEMLTEYSGRNQLPPTMIHSFSGSSEILQRLIKLGCWISFSPRLATASRLLPLFTATPLAGLLLETDSPGRPARQPAPDRKDEPTEPVAIAQLYSFAASLRGMALPEFCQEIWKNGEIFTDTILPR
jgi:TatD DNase family protein